MSRSARRLPAAGLLAALAFAAVLSPFASASPDGLERVAQQAGFVERAREGEAQKQAPLSGYAIPGVADARLATGLAGVAGTLAVFALGRGLTAALRRRPRGRAPAP